LSYNGKTLNPKKTLKSEGVALTHGLIFIDLKVKE
jgi:hypothetical protein